MAARYSCGQLLWLRELSAPQDCEDLLHKDWEVNDSMIVCNRVSGHTDNHTDLPWASCAAMCGASSNCGLTSGTDHLERASWTVIPQPASLPFLADKRRSTMPNLGVTLHSHPTLKH